AAPRLGQRAVARGPQRGDQLPGRRPVAGGERVGRVLRRAALLLHRFGCLGRQDDLAGGDRGRGGGRGRGGRRRRRRAGGRHVGGDGRRGHRGGDGRGRRGGRV